MHMVSRFIFLFDVLIINKSSHKSCYFFLINSTPKFVSYLDHFILDKLNKSSRKILELQKPNFLQIYVKTATSTKHHVQRFLLKYQCTGDQAHERTLFAEDPYLPITELGEMTLIILPILLNRSCSPTSHYIY